MAEIKAIIKAGSYKGHELNIDLSELESDVDPNGKYVRIKYYSSDYPSFKSIRDYKNGVFVVGTRIKNVGFKTGGKTPGGQTINVDIERNTALETELDRIFKKYIRDVEPEPYIKPYIDDTVYITKKTTEWDWLDNIVIIILIIMVAWLLGKTTNPNIFKVDYK